MNDDDLDRLARAALAPGCPTDAERAAAWDDILRRLVPRPRRRRRLLAVPAAMAAAATVAFALLPARDDGGPRRGLLADASAAEILHAAADRAVLGAPGAGEQLFAEQRRVVPMGEGAIATEVTRTWAARDGSGRTEMTASDEAGRPHVRRHAAGGPRTGELGSGWRAAFTAAELRALPAEPERLLAALRAAMERMVPANDELPVVGIDLAVIATTADLLVTAPIDAAQRAALFELLASAPEWTLPGSSVTPVEVTRVGVATARGVRVRVELRLTPAERQQLRTSDLEWGLELTIDPVHGRVTELREYEDGLRAPPIVTTIEAQRIVPARP